MKNARRRRLFTSLVVCIAAWATSGAALAAEPPTKCHLYLLIGQSNMAGRGKVEKEDTTPHPRVLVLNKEDQWVPAVDPLHFDKPSAGVGPGLAFGKALADADKDITIGLIPAPPAAHPSRCGRRTHSGARPKASLTTKHCAGSWLARKRGVLKGILWHQGESDGNEKDAKLYADRLADLVTRLRRDLESPQVAILLGGLSEPLRTRNEHARLVDQALRDFAGKDGRFAYVESDKLTLMGDNTHFDAASAREFGRRYAKALLKMEKN